MAALFSELGSFFSYIWGLLSSIEVVDVIDILILAGLLLYAYRFIRERRAGKLAIGILLFVLVLGLSELIGFHALHYVLSNFMQVGIIALIVLFQPELRSALERVGRDPLKSIKKIGEQKDIGKINADIGEIVTAVFEMAEEKTGALIVIERQTKLGDVIKSGTVIDSQISSFLIRNIFFNKAPLHDGAMIIRDGRMYAAGCFLPLSSNENIIKDLGTRHRAAIGMSENSDAVVICVSEENGVVSIANEGKLKRGYTPNMLKSELKDLILSESHPQKLVNIKNFRKTANSDPEKGISEEGENDENETF